MRILTAMADPPTTITTPRLTIRRARADDLQDIHLVLSDPVAMRYWSTPPHVTINQSRDWLQAMMEAPESESDDYVVVHEERVIGKAGCWRLPEIGYVFHPDSWGKGLASEALAAIIPAVFARHAIKHIEADVDPRNAASLKLLGRLGFTETGRAERTLLVGDEWCDSVYLRLMRPPQVHVPAGR